LSTDVRSEHVSFIIKQSLIGRGRPAQPECGGIDQFAERPYIAGLSRTGHRDASRTALIDVNKLIACRHIEND